MIQAYAAKAASNRLKPFSYKPSPLKDDDVEIGIEFCGLCYSDVHLIDNDWKISNYPLVPGHEIIGKVVKKGSRVQELEIGQRVGVGWQSGACLHCKFCIQGDETVCPSKVRTCVEQYGGFADKIVVDYHFAYPLPSQLDPQSSAPLFCAGITAYSPFKIYNVKAPHSVAVIGIGGLGHLALQFAHAFGCDVTAISSSADKEKEARKFGASHFLSTSDKPPSGSFDFILSTTHADLDWSSILKLLAPHGKLCFIGLPSKEITLPARLLISGNRSICGSGTGSRALMQEMLLFSARHKITPQIELFPMSQINEAIHRLKSNQARYRIVLKN